MIAVDGLTIVAEGIVDIHLIRVILGNELTGVMRFFAGQGRTSLATLARNLLVHEGSPVLLVMDSETLSPPLRQELQSMAMLAMGGVAAAGMFEVFTFVPEIEVVFFEAPNVLEMAIGQQLPRELLEEGKLAPKRTLGRILADRALPGIAGLLRELDQNALEMLSQGKQATALREKVEMAVRDRTPGMAPQIQSLSFEAQDSSGNRYRIVSEREVVYALHFFPRLGPWRFKLEDGRSVIRNGYEGCYLVTPGNLRLITTDPKEPKD